MRVGSLVYATEQGLGYLAKSFYDHGVVTDPIVVSYTARGQRPMRTDWYPDAPVIGNFDAAEVYDLVDSVDVMLFFETPFNWKLIDYCRERGKKSMLMPMHECLDKNRANQHKPDLFLCPSLLDEMCVLNNIDSATTQFLPVPVEVPWRQRTRAEVFVHNAGHGGLRGRNGTKELLEALKLVKSPIKFILRSQDEMRYSLKEVWAANPKLDLQGMYGTQPFDQLWDEGDVFVFPEKFNGLSLPLQEARAAGMLVMGTDRFPMNTWLPTKVPTCQIGNKHIVNLDGSEGVVDYTKEFANPLIPVHSYNKGTRTFPQFMPFDEVVVRPEDIAAKIDEWYGRDITQYSRSGKEWAEATSWERLKPQYMAALERLCMGDLRN